MIFLHGGGDDVNSRIDTFGRFVQTSSVNSACYLALVVAEPTPEQASESFETYSEIFTSLPIAPTKIHPVFVSPTKPLNRAQLESIRPTGVFICGGSTPLYHQSLCLDTDWTTYVLNSNVPYGGTSAGAAIASKKSILGGWQATRNSKTREILFQGASEGLDAITVRDGLGLVPFAIDVHASQMGTLTRLIHAVDLGLVSEGWAIDENTVLQIDHDHLSIYGQGHVYRVWRKNKDCVNVSILEDSKSS
jgi:cyanophycinase